jgi:hypothetical protein
VKHEEIITLVLGLMRGMTGMMTGRMCEHEEIITLVLGLMREMTGMMSGRL